MKTEFLFKRVVFIFWSAFSFIFTIFSCFYAVYLQQAMVVQNSRNFYFLVTTSTHIEVSAQTSRWLGGAGYVMHTGDKDYVAYAVYTKQTDGENATRSLMEKVEDVKLVCFSASPLYLKKSEDKRKVSIYKGAFGCLFSHIDALNREIKRLHDGATQQSVKRFLQIQLKQFSYMQKQYQDTFSAFSSVCEKACQMIEEICKEIIYLKDVRYLLCFLSQSYINLSEKFRL